MSPDRRANLWITFTVVAVFLGILVGGYFLFDWASDQTPWFKRIVFSILGVSVGGRIGLALSGNRANKKGPNWIFWGMLLLSLGLAIYFGFVRPIQRDRERDEAFTSIRDGLRGSTESLNKLVAEAPDANDRPAVIQYLGSVSAQGHTAIGLMQKAHDQLGRFTTEQKTELVEESKKAKEALRIARERFGELSPKKKE